MENKVLIDTNVLLDYILMREPYYKEARDIVHLCEKGKIRECIAAHSITNMFFILRKDYCVKERREILTNICNIFQVEGITKHKLLSALSNETFLDFEDCLQMECAKECDAQQIITRNIDDFCKSEIKAILPGDFLKIGKENVEL